MMRRSGITLVETAGVVSAVGMLLSLSAILLSKTFDAHRATLKHLQSMRSLDMFIDRWREDVHASTKVTPTASGTELTIAKGNDVEVLYSVSGSAVLRTRREGEQEIGQDRWQLPSPCKIIWQIEDQGRIPLLVGSLKFEGEPSVFGDVSVVARIGSGVNK